MDLNYRLGHKNEPETVSCDPQLHFDPLFGNAPQTGNFIDDVEANYGCTCGERVDLAAARNGRVGYNEVAGMNWSGRSRFLGGYAVVF